MAKPQLDSDGARATVSPREVSSAAPSRARRRAGIQVAKGVCEGSNASKRPTRAGSALYIRCTTCSRRSAYFRFPPENETVRAAARGFPQSAIRERTGHRRDHGPDLRERRTLTSGGLVLETLGAERRLLGFSGDVGLLARSGSGGNLMGWGGGPLASASSLRLSTLSASASQRAAISSSERRASVLNAGLARLRHSAA
jgi:hypothetical protein